MGRGVVRRWGGGLWFAVYGVGDAWICVLHGGTRLRKSEGGAFIEECRASR